MTRPNACDYAEHRYDDDSDEPCTGPVAPHDCGYERELADDGAVVKQCRCCRSCAHECSLNI